MENNLTTQDRHGVIPTECSDEEACEPKKQTCSIDLRKLERYALRIIRVTLATFAETFA